MAKTQKDNKLKKLIDKNKNKWKNRKTSREFKIVMSGQFRTLAMFSLTLPVQTHCRKSRCVLELVLGLLNTLIDHRKLPQRLALFWQFLTGVALTHRIQPVFYMGERQRSRRPYIRSFQKQINGRSCYFVLFFPKYANKVLETTFCSQIIFPAICWHPSII